MAEYQSLVEYAVNGVIDDRKRKPMNSEADSSKDLAVMKFLPKKERDII